MMIMTMTGPPSEVELAGRVWESVVVVPAWGLLSELPMFQ